MWTDCTGNTGNHELLSSGIADTDRSDEQLAAAFLQHRPGSADAFSLLAARHRPGIYRRCLFRLGNPDDAEDATQDVLLRLYTRLHQFQGRSSLKTWLNTIIDNYCTSYAVKRARLQPDDNIEQRLEIQQQRELPNDDDRDEARSLVLCALSALPDNARQVLSLRFYGEHSLQEIARILAVSLSAAKARLYRALQQLALMYSRFENGYRPCDAYHAGRSDIPFALASVAGA